MGFTPFTKLGSAIGKAASSIADATGSAAKSTLGALETTASAVAGAAVSGGKAVASTTAAVTKAGGEAVLGAALSSGKAVAKGAAVVTDAAVHGGKTVVNTTVNVTKASGEAVVKGAAAVADAAVSGGKAVVNTTVGATLAGGEAVVGAAVHGGKALAKGASAVADATASAISATGSAIAGTTRGILPEKPEKSEAAPRYLRAELLETTGGPHPAWLFIGAAVLLAATAEMGDFLISRFQSSPVLGGIWAAVVALFLCGIWLAFRSDRKSMRGLLSQKAVMEETSPRRVRKLLSHKNLSLEQQPWEQACAKLRGDDAAEEVRSLYSAMVLEPHVDKRAADIIRQSCLRAGLTVMVSPFALVDMFSVLAISSRMMRRIAETYGIGLSLRAQMRVYAYVIRNISVAGAADLGTDLLSQLGAKWAEVLAAKAGQGILAGRYVIRLGILVAMACRPVAFTEENLLSYSDLFAGMLSGMRGRLPQEPSENRIDSMETRNERTAGH